MSLVTIFGMHRSGTSFLCRRLHAAGLCLGSGVQRAANHDNLEGHWESLEAVSINDRILAQSGGAWHTVPAELRVDAESHARMAAFVAGLAKHPAAGWKDPRTTLTWPCWRPHLPQQHRIVAAFRHPLAVACSLHTRDGWPLERGLALWADYNQKLLEIADSEGRDILWFDFDVEPDAMEARLRCLCRRLGLSAAGTAIFNRFLRHHVAERIESSALNSRICSLYERLRLHAGKPLDTDATDPPILADGPASAPDVEQLACVVAAQNGILQRDRLQSMARMARVDCEIINRSDAQRLHMAHFADRLADMERQLRQCHELVNQVRSMVLVRCLVKARRGLRRVYGAIRAVMSSLANGCGILSARRGR